MPHLEGLYGSVVVVEGVSPHAGGGHGHRAVGERGAANGGERICHTIHIGAAEITTHRCRIRRGIVHPAGLDSLSGDVTTDHGGIIAPGDAETGGVLIGAAGIATFTHPQHKAVCHALAFRQGFGVAIRVVEAVDQFAGIHRQQHRAIGAGFLIRGALPVGVTPAVTAEPGEFEFGFGCDRVVTGCEGHAAGSDTGCAVGNPTSLDQNHRGRTRLDAR